MTTEEEDSEIKEATDALVMAYILSLSRAALEVNISGMYHAFEDLNQAREKEGLPAVPIDMNKINMESINAANEYQKMLEERGGSYVVEVVGDTEKYVFKPWLNSLSSDLQKQVKDTMDKALMESWTHQTLRENLRKIGNKGLNYRAQNAAFTETRTLQYQAQMRAWGFGGLQFVQRHAVVGSNTCLTCVLMDNRVYKLGEEPPLSHINCRCYYTPYITKAGWTPDSDITLPPSVGKKSKIPESAITTRAITYPDVKPVSKPVRVNRAITYPDINPEVTPKPASSRPRIIASQPPIVSRAELESRIRAKESELWGFKNENAVIWDRDTGEILLDKAGTEHAVQVSFEVKGKTNPMILTHNHPNGTSFSQQDLLTASGKSFVEIRATSPYNTYQLRMKDGTPLKVNKTKFKKLFDNHLKDVINERLPEYRKGATIVQEDLKREIGHETWNRVARDMPELEYTKVKH